MLSGLVKKSEFYKSVTKTFVMYLLLNIKVLAKQFRFCYVQFFIPFFTTVDLGSCMGNGGIRPDSWFVQASFAPILFPMGMIRTVMIRPYVFIYIRLYFMFRK